MKKLKSTIKEVTVYIDRARIIRTAHISADTGNQIYEVRDLPITIEPDSVRARAKGTARAKIRGVDVKKIFFQDIPPGKAKELMEEIEKLEDKEKSLSDQSETLSEQISHLDGLSKSTRTFARGLAKGESSIDSQSALIDFFGNERQKFQAKIREITIKKRDLSKNLQKLKKEFAQVQKSRPKERYSASIELDITRAGDLDIQIIYMISGARWIPLYDIRLHSSEIEITYIGQVSQSTGEDWQKVSLSLSSAHPSSATVVPKLDPWFISPAIPVRSVAMAAAPTEIMRKNKKMVLEEGLTAGAEIEDDLAEVEEVTNTTAKVSHSGVSVTYSIDSLVDIPGDGSPHKTVIAFFNLPVERDYVTAPQITPDVYRRIVLNNDSEYMLLAGVTQLFENDDFIGSTNLKLTAPGQKIKLYFGIDDRMRIDRKLVSQETDKKFITDKRRIHYGYEIKIENHTDQKQKLTVRDQIPVSRHEDIKVKLEDSDPKITKIDELNRLHWQLNLESKGKKRIRFDFTVEYPRDMLVEGLL